MPVPAVVLEPEPEPAPAPKRNPFQASIAPSAGGADAWPPVVVAPAPARNFIVEAGSIEIPPELDGSRRKRRNAWIISLFLIVGFAVMIAATIMSHNRPH
jgi:hypothetical protein